MNDLTPEVKEACRLAVHSVLKTRRNARQVYYDTLQDAYIIALSKRGKKEAKTPQEYYWKVRYGLIDLFREQTHIRCYQRQGIEMPVILSLDDDSITADFKDSAPSYRRWLSERKGKVFTYIDKENRLVRVTEEQVRDAIETILKLFPRREQAWILEWINGKTLLTIGKENGLSEPRISIAVSRFKKEIRKLLSERR